MKLSEYEKFMITITIILIVIYFVVTKMVSNM